MQLKKLALLIVLFALTLSAAVASAQDATEEPQTFEYIVENGNIKLTFGENTRIVEAHLTENIGEVMFERQEGSKLLMAGPKGWFLLQLGDAPFYDIRYSSHAYSAGFSGTSVYAWRITATEKGVATDLVFWQQERSGPSIGFVSYELRMTNDYGPFSLPTLTLPQTPEEWNIIAAWGVANPQIQNEQ